MQYRILKQTNKQIMYDLLDDNHELVFGNGVYEGDISNIDTLMTDKIIPAFVEGQAKDNKVVEEPGSLTDAEQKMVSDKKELKIKIIASLLTADNPTPDSIADSLPDSNANFVKFLLEMYQELNYIKGYTPDQTWGTFVADIKAHTPEQLLSRT